MGFYAGATIPRIMVFNLSDEYLDSGPQAYSSNTLLNKSSPQTPKTVDFF